MQILDSFTFHFRMQNKATISQKREAAEEGYKKPEKQEQAKRDQKEGEGKRAEKEGNSYYRFKSFSPF